MREHMVSYTGPEVPHVLTATLLTALQVGVAMELGKLLGVHVAPTVESVNILTDGELHLTDLMQLHHCHVRERGEGLRRKARRGNTR